MLTISSRGCIRQGQRRITLTDVWWADGWQWMVGGSSCQRVSPEWVRLTGLWQAQLRWACNASNRCSQHNTVYRNHKSRDAHNVSTILGDVGVRKEQTRKC